MWKYKILQCESTEATVMGCFCTPCLFGINQSKLDLLDGLPNPSCIPGCFTYSFINMLWQIIGIMYVTSIYSIIGIPIDPNVSQMVSICWGSIGTGLYGLNTRKRIRDKYGIIGDKRTDCVMYTCMPQCAVIQESQEIDGQARCNNGYVSIPELQWMEKD